MKSKTQGTCTYCGTSGIVTQDHIPPKNLFAKPRPDLLWTPACVACHEAAETSKDDEYFRDILIQRKGIDTSNPNVANALAAWRRSLARPEARRKLEAFRQSIRWNDVVTPNGIFLGRVPAYAVKTHQALRVVLRTVRGLYRHRFGTILPPSVGVLGYPKTFFDDAATQANAAATEWLNGVLHGLLTYGTKFKIGDGSVFRYVVVAKPGDPLSTHWILQFYLTTEYLVVTVPEGTDGYVDLSVDPPEEG
jgi:hypothetical protein